MGRETSIKIKKNKRIERNNLHKASYINIDRLTSLKGQLIAKTKIKENGYEIRKYFEQLSQTQSVLLFNHTRFDDFLKSSIKSTLDKSFWPPF